VKASLVYRMKPRNKKIIKKKKLKTKRIHSEEKINSQEYTNSDLGKEKGMFLRWE